MTEAESAFGPTRRTEVEASARAHCDDVSGSGTASAWPQAPTVEGRGGWPGKTRARIRAGRVLALGLTATVATALTIAGCGSSHSSSPQSTPSATQAAHKTKPKENCGSSGCAMVRASRSLPAPTILYGASCTGVHGEWFFNATEGGSSDALRPSYALLWSFKGGATSAKPSARTINVPHTTTTSVTMTLTNGTLKLTGMRKPNTTVSATGSLVVKLTGSASSLSLTFIESGLASAEQKLGLVSPFNAGGRPLAVPIQHVTSLPAC